MCVCVCEYDLTNGRYAQVIVCVCVCVCANTMADVHRDAANVGDTKSDESSFIAFHPG